MISLTRKSITITVIALLMTWIMNDTVAFANIPVPSDDFKTGYLFYKMYYNIKDPKDNSLQKAAQFFLKGYENQNCPYCTGMLAEFYAYGVGGLKKDITKAFNLAKKSNEANCAIGSYMLGSFYLNGSKAGLPQNKESGEKYMLNAIRLGSLRKANVHQQLFGAFAAFDLGYAYTKRKIQKEDSKEIALSYYDKALVLYNNTLKASEAESKRDELQDLHKLLYIYYMRECKKDIELAQRNIIILKNNADLYANDPYPIVKAYVDNEIAADRDFKGKIIRVTGQIAEIGRSFGDIYVKFSPPNILGFKTIYCYFDENQADDVAKLKRFEKATIQGKCIGMKADIIFTDCSVVKNN